MLGSQHYLTVTLNLGFHNNELQATACAVVFVKDDSPNRLNQWKDARKLERNKKKKNALQTSASRSTSANVSSFPSCQVWSPVARMEAQSFLRVLVTVISSA